MRGWLVGSRERRVRRGEAERSGAGTGRRQQQHQRRAGEEGECCADVTNVSQGTDKYYKQEQVAIMTAIRVNLSYRVNPHLMPPSSTSSSSPSTLFSIPYYFHFLFICIRLPILSIRCTLTFPALPSFLCLHPVSEYFITF